MAKEAGHNFLARLGKTKLRPGGAEATGWLIEKAQITKDTRILEVACNMGTTMIGLAKKYGCHVTGIDMDENALAKAKANISENGLEDLLSVQQGNAMQLPFEDGSFDVVINEAMLTMLSPEQKDKALSEYARVLKTGGKLLTHDVCFRTDDVKTKSELEAELTRTINVHAQPLTVDGWKDLIEKHGFVTTQKSGAMTLMDPEGMIRDEGKDGALKIFMNAMKKENFPTFVKMFRFFNDNKESLGYVANFSVKE